MQIKFYKNILKIITLIITYYQGTTQQVERPTNIKNKVVYLKFIFRVFLC